MATRTTLTLEDDLDGGSADLTVRFSLDGSDYEIDLNTTNASVFRSRLAPFLAHARLAAGRRSRSAPTTSSRERARQIRDWAISQGIPVNSRGRISASVIERFEAACSRSC
jgi:hypothetical protein